MAAGALRPGELISHLESTGDRTGAGMVKEGPMQTVFTSSEVCTRANLYRLLCDFLSQSEARAGSKQNQSEISTKRVWSVRLWGKQTGFGFPCDWLIGNVA